MTTYVFIDISIMLIINVLITISLIRQECDDSQTLTLNVLLLKIVTYISKISCHWYEYSNQLQRFYLFLLTRISRKMNLSNSNEACVWYVENNSSMLRNTNGSIRLLAINKKHLIFFYNWTPLDERHKHRSLCKIEMIQWSK